MFRLIRKKDALILGHVLDGVIFDDGTTVIRWDSETPSTAIYNTFEDFKLLHIGNHPNYESEIQYYEIGEIKNNDQR